MSEKENSGNYSFEDMRLAVKEEFGEEGIILKSNPDNSKTFIKAEIGDNRMEFTQTLNENGEETLNFKATDDIGMDEIEISKSPSGEITTKGWTEADFNALKEEFDMFLKIAYGLDSLDSIVEKSKGVRVSVDSDEVVKWGNEEVNLLEEVGRSLGRQNYSQRDTLILIAEVSKYEFGPKGGHLLWVKGVKEIANMYGFEKWKLMFQQQNKETGQVRECLMTSSEREKEEKTNLY